MCAICCMEAPNKPSDSEYGKDMLPSQTQATLKHQHDDYRTQIATRQLKKNNHRSLTQQGDCKTRKGTLNYITKQRLNIKRLQTMGANAKLIIEAVIVCCLKCLLNMVENMFLCKQSKKEGKDQESIQSSTTPDPGYQWESDRFSIRHHK